MPLNSPLRLSALLAVLVLCGACASVSRQFDRLARFIDGEDRIEMEGSTAEVTALVPENADVFDPVYNEPLAEKNVAKEADTKEPQIGSTQNENTLAEIPPESSTGALSEKRKGLALPEPTPLAHAGGNVQTQEASEGISTDKVLSPLAKNDESDNIVLAALSGEVVIELDTKASGEISNKSLVRLIPIDAGLQKLPSQLTPKLNKTNIQLLSSAEDTATDHIVDMKNKTYLPQYLAARKNDTVIFTNSDDIRHNVFSRSGKNAFDLGTYAAGKKRGVTFKEPGIVKVYCNIHPNMATFVSVIENGYSTISDAQGKFSFEAVPVGQYLVEAWNIRGSVDAKVKVSAEQANTLRLVVSVLDPEFVEHSNKFGEKYPAKTALFGDEFY